MGFEQNPDYITVAERIVEFRTRFPDGSLQPANLDKPYTIEVINGNQCFVVVAAAYRNDEDERPGIGMAYEPIPGATPYTRGSELQNAETAAWGRAIVAVLAADTKRGIATREEIAPREAERKQPARRANPKLEAALADWRDQIADAGTHDEFVALYHRALAAKAPQVIIDEILVKGNAS